MSRPPNAMYLVRHTVNAGSRCRISPISLTSRLRFSPLSLTTARFDRARISFSIHTSVASAIRNKGCVGDTHLTKSEETALMLSTRQILSPACNITSAINSSSRK